MKDFFSDFGGGYLSLPSKANCIYRKKIKGAGGERGVFFLATVFITFTKSNLSSKHREHILWREKIFQDITKYFQVFVNI